MDVVKVELGSRSYEVRIADELIGRAGEEIAPLLNRPDVAIITEENVAEEHLAELQLGLAVAGITSEALILPPGEGTKS